MSKTDFFITENWQNSGPYQYVITGCEDDSTEFIEGEFHYISNRWVLPELTQPSGDDDCIWRQA